MTDRELMQQALEAFEWNYNTDLDNIPACEQWAKMLKENIAALRSALAEPELVAEANFKEQGWRQCAKGQRTTQYCGMVEQAVQAEREACAKVCEEIEMQGHALWDRTADPDAQGRATGAMDCAAAIRSRT